MLAAAVAAIAMGASLASLAASGGGRSAGVGAAPASTSRDPDLASPAQPAFRVPAPTTLRTSRFESTWATVRSATYARAAPRRRAPIVGRLEPRTPEGTTNIVLTLEREDDPQGSLWVRVRLPALPNNTTGWVPRSTLGGYGVVRTRLVVDLSDLQLTLFRDGEAIFRTPVGIGTTQFPTPPGRSLVLLLAIATLIVAPPALGQKQTPDLSDLWTEYPLDPNQDDPRPAGSRERDASIWGPPPDEPQPAGPFAVVLFYLALGLGVLGIAGAIRALPILHFGGGASSARRVVADHDDDLGLHEGPEAGEQASDDGPATGSPR